MRLLVSVMAIVVLAVVPSPATADEAPTVCEYDAATQSVSITPGTFTRDGEQYPYLTDANEQCGVPPGAAVKGTHVYYTSTPARYIGGVIKPDGSGYKYSTTLHAPPGVDDFELNIDLSYPLTRTLLKIPTLKGYPNGLDYDADGVLDLAIEGTESWRVRKITASNVTAANSSVSNITGTIDLRDVPMPPGSALRATFWFSEQPIVFYGPRSGPDVTVHTGRGNDIIHTYGGNDTIGTGGGNDRVWSRGGDDVIALNRGHDIAYAGAGNDQIYADGTWFWTPRVESGKDRVYAGPGTNYVRLAGGQDLVIGGSGRDMVSTHHSGGYVLRLGRGMDQYDFSNGPLTGRYRRVVDCGSSRFDFLDIGSLQDRSGRILPEYRSRAPRFIGCERKRRKYTGGKIAYRFPYSVDATGERHYQCGANRDWCPADSVYYEIDLTGGWM